MTAEEPAAVPRVPFSAVTGEHTARTSARLQQLLDRTRRQAPSTPLPPPHIPNAGPAASADSAPAADPPLGRFAAGPVAVGAAARPRPRPAEQIHGSSATTRAAATDFAATDIAAAEAAPTATSPPASAERRLVPAAVVPVRARRPVRRRDRPPRSTMSTQAIVDNLVFTTDAVTGWFVLAPASWSFRSDAECEAVVLEAAGRLGRLTGRRCHLRITSRPFPVRDWAQALDADARAAGNPLPGACPNPGHRYGPAPGCDRCAPAVTWMGFLRDEQQAIQRWGLDEKSVFLGIDISRRSALDRLTGRALRDAVRRQTRRLDDQVQEIADLVAGTGLAAAPATARQMEWLMHRSCSLGLPPPLPLADQPAPVPHALAATAPGRWDSGDLPEFTGRARWTCEPFDRTVTVTGITATGEHLTRHVAILTLGVMSPIDVPEATPWLQRTDALPFEVEWSITCEVRRSGEVTREMRDKIARRRGQLRHYAEHDLDPPLELEEQTEESRRIEDEQQHGFGGAHARLRGWFRLAVAGATRQETLSRAAQIAELYEPGITVVHPADQYRLAREFIPGEPLANLAHARRMPVTMLVGGMPQATSRIGDPAGFFIGFTCGGGRAVTWAPWRGTEIREESGLVPIIGTQGAGKSTLAGLITFKAVRAGVAATVLDPAGMLAEMCRLPALAPHAKAIDLLHAEPGTLSPYAVIPEPSPDDFAVDDLGRTVPAADAEQRWHAGMLAAQARRRALSYDVLRMLLEPDLLDQETIFALKEAVDQAPATADASPWQVIEALRHLGGGLSERAQLIARDLERTARHPEAQLFFPAGTAAQNRDLGRFGLTVLTLRGLVVPNQHMQAREWSTEERLSGPLLHLAAWLTHRLVYGRPRHQRKLLVIDEAHAITRSPVGRMLINTTARDSRKRNTVALVISQNGADLLEAGIGNLRGPVFVGRTEGTDEQQQALQLLGLGQGTGYEQDLATLSPRHLDGRTGSREFVMRLAGQIERVQIDMGVDAALRQALDTTADPARAHPKPPPTPSTPATGLTQPTGAGDAEDRGGRPW